MRGVLTTAVAVLFAVFQQADAQDFDIRKDLEKAKAAIRGSADEAPDYHAGGLLLEKIVSRNNSNAEAWYFLGYAIDKTNAPDGEGIPQLQLPLTQKASEAFQKAVSFSSNGVYTGELLVLDPHTKILTVWGSQALHYLYQNKRDSAIWCYRQAAAKGGVNPTMMQYFKQVLGECSRNAYLFTNGDLYLYYLNCLQLVEKVRPDVTCIDLNLLNTQWYPVWLNAKGLLKTAYAPADLAKLPALKWDPQTTAILQKNGQDTMISWKLLPNVDKKWLSRSNRILLDLLQQNAFEKDVFFAADVPTGMSLNLDNDNYLQCRGLTNKLVTQLQATDLAFLKERLKALSYLPAVSAGYLDNRDNVQLLNNYRFAFTTAASIAFKRGDTASAKQLMEAVDRKYPVSRLPFFADATRQWFEQLKKKIAGQASLE